LFSRDAASTAGARFGPCAESSSVSALAVFFLLFDAPEIEIAAAGLGRAHRK
jgi:hypothetical protein